MNLPAGNNAVTFSDNNNTTNIHQMQIGAHTVESNYVTGEVMCLVSRVSLPIIAGNELVICHPDLRSRKEIRQYERSFNELIEKLKLCYRAINSSTLHLLAVVHIAKPISHLRRYMYPWIFGKIHEWI
jgi:hypothetical protein